MFALVKQLVKHQFFVFTFISFISFRALTCESYLLQQGQNQSEKQRFNQDCSFQDEYRYLKNAFQKEFRIDIRNLNEYKALRFIDRVSWETAKQYQKPIDSIYEPAPITWSIWSNGIGSILSQNGYGNLFNNPNITIDRMAFLNKTLLTQNEISIQSDKTDLNIKPGQFRTQSDSQNGFCSRESFDHKLKAQISEQSMRELQFTWESKIKNTFRQIVENEKGLMPYLVTLGAELRGLVPGCGPLNDGVWVSYVRSELVLANMDWIRIFLKTNIQYYLKNKPLLPPTELAALIQKWFVTVHPFADGNGRTSRALQELILDNFDLPMVAAGDLQNDALEDYQSYIHQNYDSTRKTLNLLSDCLQEYRQKSEISFKCKVVK